MLVALAIWQGLIGFLLFSERISLMWMFGVMLILAGLLCIQWGSSDSNESKSVSQAKNDACRSLDASDPDIRSTSHPVSSAVSSITQPNSASTPYGLRRRPRTRDGPVR